MVKRGNAGAGPPKARSEKFSNTWLWHCDAALDITPALKSAASISLSALADSLAVDRNFLQRHIAGIVWPAEEV